MLVTGDVKLNMIKGTLVKTAIKNGHRQRWAQDSERTKTEQKSNTDLTKTQVLVKNKLSLPPYKTFDMLLC